MATSLSRVFRLYTTKVRLFCPASASTISASEKLGGVLFADVLFRIFEKEAIVWFCHPLFLILLFIQLAMHLSPCSHCSHHHLVTYRPCSIVMDLPDSCYIVLFWCECYCVCYSIYSKYCTLPTFVTHFYRPLVPTATLSQTLLNCHRLARFTRLFTIIVLVSVIVSVIPFIPNIVHCPLVSPTCFLAYACASHTVYSFNLSLSFLSLLHSPHYQSQDHGILAHIHWPIHSSN